MSLKVGNKFIILESTRILERINIDLIYPDGFKLRAEENYFMKLDECKAVYLNRVDTFRIDEAV